MVAAAGSPRRFSYWGDASRLVGISVWKFDVSILKHGLEADRRTCYVKHGLRHTASGALFAQHPDAKIFGNGLPLTDAVALEEVGRPLSDGEVLLVDEGD